ncbi:GGDEF domain-containing protein [Persephonella sp.]
MSDTDNKNLIEETHIDKIRLIYSFTILGASALYLFSFIHFIGREYFIAWFEAIIATGAIFNIILLKLSKGRLINVAENFILIGTIILLTGIIIHGGIANTAIYWIYTYPLLSFFFKGNRAGLFWNILLIAVIISLAILDYLEILNIPYTFPEIRQALSAYVVIMVLAYVFESALLSSYEKIKKLATTDPLTGAYNRYQLFKKLEEEIERSNRYGNRLSLIMFDIDNFKSINDTYGHHIGDQVLKTTIETIKRYLRRTDILGRFGGEEFMIICPDVDDKGARNIAEKIRKLVKDLKVENIPEITISIGVAEYTPGEDITEFIKKADIALYSAKKKGKNRVEIYNSDSICLIPVRKEKQLA